MSGDGGHGGGGHGKRRGHEEEHEEHENHERWLVSYADMMTLLMVLFIVMFAISQVDQKKFMALKTGLSAGFGSPVAILISGDQLLDPGGAVAPDSVNLAGDAGGDQKNGSNSPQISAGELAKIVNQAKQLADATNKASVADQVKELQEAKKELQKALVKAGVPKGASFRFDERGLVVSIATDKVLFDNGGATLLPAGQKILNALTPTLSALPNKLSIDGHTNSVPIRSAEFPSNWELAADRATGVLRYLTKAIPADRMSASAFADTKPLKPGTSPAALVANRRVEIVVLAYLDPTAGKALAELGNETSGPAQETGTDTASSEPGTTAPETTTESTSAAGSPDDNLWETPSPSPEAAGGSGDWTSDTPAAESTPTEETGSAGTKSSKKASTPSPTGEGDWTSG